MGEIFGKGEFGMFEIFGYTINERIYEGNVTTIFKANRIKDNVNVVIKVPNSQHPDLSVISKLKHEYEINSKINSNYVIKIYKLEMINNIPVLIQEDFTGIDLGKFMLIKILNTKEFLEIAKNIVEAIKDIHRCNIIHNNINPSNILINTETKDIKIIDFGIATLLNEDNKYIYNDDHNQGMLQYISPEQTGRMKCKIDYRTDFYSLGIVFYEMLTGSVPFKAKDGIGLIHSHLAVQPLSPNKVDTNVPEVISDIVMKLISKMVQGRYHSALGLLSDLKLCLYEFQETGEINPFEIGKNDVSDNFKIPHKLYGRDEEIESLLFSFQRIRNREKEIKVISGYSGVGKSALVNDLQSPITKNHGHFVYGKFEQFQHDLPYLTLVQAFKGLIHVLLTESREKVDIWRDKLLDVLGPNGQVIIEVIPDVEKITGKMQNVIELPPEETKNRFNLVFKNFMSAFCTKENPLVVFLDDLQWADLATLKLIETLMSDVDINYLMIIVAYRDNELDEVNSTKLALENIKKIGVNYSEINLKPLELKSIIMLLSDALECSVDKVEGLARLCLQKTAGNPFFLIQFLQLLYQEKLIKFNININCWEWDINLIKTSGITDNVVELMIRKIQRLPRSVQKILTLAACIGNKFDLKILSILSKLSLKEAYNNLIEALSEGLIIIDENSFSYRIKDLSTIKYQFSHDRIQQAACGFIEVANREKVQLNLGRIILSNTDKKDYEENIFDILNHYNLGINLVVEPAEREILARLEMMAGKKAKKAMAYEIANRCFKLGIELLEESKWQTQYELTLAIYAEAAETSYLNGNFQEMVELTETVHINAKSILDKVNTYKIKIQAYAAQGKIYEAIDIAVELIKILGKNISKNPNNLRILFKLLKAKIVLRGKSIDDIVKLPLMKNEDYLAILSIITLIGSISYRTNPSFMSEIIIEAVLISIKYGNPPESPSLYSTYGLVLCALGDIEAGYLFGKLALGMVKTLNVEEQVSKVIFVNNAFIAHWKEPLGELLPKFKEGYQIGLDGGDYEFAAYNGFYYCNKSYYAGKNLEELDAEMIFFIDKIKKLNQEPQLYLTQMMCQLVRNLKNINSNPLILCGEIYDENVMLPIHFNTKDNTAVSSVYILKLMLSYIFKKYDEGIKYADLTEKYIDSLRSTVAVPIYHFYGSLARLANYNLVSPSKQRELMKKVLSSQKKMKKWAECGPMNYSHKYYLVQAEIARVKKDELRAIKNYNTAIELATKNSFIQDEALANELVARYYSMQGEKKLEKLYLTEAHYAYILWGAFAKTKQLEEENPTFEFSVNVSKHGIQKSEHVNLSNPKGTRFYLDNATIVKATQAISGEIILDELLKKLVYILLENAGAQKVLYMVKKESKYLIQAEGYAENKLIHVMKDRLMANSDSSPEKIIYYVDHSKEMVIIDNASTSRQYMNDPYIIRNHPKSIMCLPVLSKGKTLGILYLENSLIEGVFNSERIEILKVISSQLAISLENANIYNHLEEMVEERTRELIEEIAERKKAQKLLEEMATHDSLTSLGNRKLFMDALNHSIELGKQNKFICAVLFVDLDNFKAINDTYGHNYGDIVLKATGARLLKTIRACDTVSRWGGDEFIVILENIESVASIKTTCERIISEIRKKIILGRNEGYVTASIGISVFPLDGENIEELIKKADDAMYKAKKSGSNKYVFNS